MMTVIVMMILGMRVRMMTMKGTRDEKPRLASHGIVHTLSNMTVGMRIGKKQTKAGKSSNSLGMVRNGGKVEDGDEANYG